MSIKNQVINFLKENVSLNLNTKDGFELFTQSFPEVKRTSFLFYRNQAIKDGVIEAPIIETSSQVVSTQINSKEFQVKTIDLDNIDMSRFTAIQTGTTFDKIASKRNGIMPGTVYMITGESGAGKTSISTNIADYLKENNEGYTAGFISCEMDADDWTEECLDNNRLANLETLFMLDYIDAPNYCEILDTALRTWKFAILDSFEVVIDQLKDLKGWTAKKCEAWLINLLRRASADTGCTILVIQQFTKGGTFVGSNKIKHLLTGMMIVRFDSDGNRYLEFTKNRRGGHMVGKRLYFTKNKETGRLEFDTNKFETAEQTEEIIANEAAKAVTDNNLFDDEILARARAIQEKNEKIAQRKNTERLNTISSLVTYEETTVDA